MLNWAVVGIGDIAKKRVLAALRDEPRSRLLAAVTTHPERARRICEPHGVERFYSALEEALADSDVQAVYVATPPFLHAPQAMAAMRAGRHVLCEKPAALNYQEACRMAETAQQCGVVYGVAFYRPFYPKVQRARRLIEEGALGKVTLVEAAYHWWWAPAEGQERRWFVEPRQSGGGPLPDVGSHRIDLLNYLFGPPCSVVAEIVNQVHHYPAEDSATVIMSYDSGLRAILDVRWNSRVERDELRIIGSEAELDLTPGNGPSLVFRSAAGTRTEQLPPHPNLHYPMIENFVSAVLEGAELLSSGRRALQTNRVIDAAYESARTGRRVRL
jgi:predicted dehydrogenase